MPKGPIKTLFTDYVADKPGMGSDSEGAVYADGDGSIQRVIGVGHKSAPSDGLKKLGRK
jgi:hypothetical protein